MQERRSMRGIHLVTRLQRISLSSHSSHSSSCCEDSFDRGEIVMVPENAMKAFEEAAKEYLEHFNEIPDNDSYLTGASTLYSGGKRRPKFRPAIIKKFQSGGGESEVYLLATFGRTPYQDLNENTQSLVVPIANKVVSKEDLPVESIQTHPTWPLPFQYVITKSVFVSEVRHWYPGGARYWVKHEDMETIRIIGVEQIRKLNAMLPEYRGRANGWLKDIRREAHKASSEILDADCGHLEQFQAKTHHKDRDFTQASTIHIISLTLYLTQFAEDRGSIIEGRIIH
ncbi:hypothetical protein VKT23_004734 [Stygiomarasmius scandens]|uniref:DIX domain-containing protein n=1 Tax=Marasmiellus scandens TaxID=2682957 RepID=A0ABR1JXT7_9AGAR